MAWDFNDITGRCEQVGPYIGERPTMGLQTPEAQYAAAAQSALGKSYLRPQMYNYAQRAYNPLLGQFLMSEYATPEKAEAAKLGESPFFADWVRDPGRYSDFTTATGTDQGRWNPAQTLTPGTYRHTGTGDIISPDQWANLAEVGDPGRAQFMTKADFEFLPGRAYQAGTPMGALTNMPFNEADWRNMIGYARGQATMGGDELIAAAGGQAEHDRWERILTGDQAATNAQALLGMATYDPGGGGVLAGIRGQGRAREFIDWQARNPGRGDVDWLGYQTGQRGRVAEPYYVA